MTTETGEHGEPTDQMLGDMVRDAGEYYAKFKQQQVNQRRASAAIIGTVVWFATFVGLGLTVYFNVKPPNLNTDLLWAFLTSVAGGLIVGGVMYFVRRQGGFKFEEVGALLDKMKQGKVSSEDGLHLMDLMHQAALTMRKQRLDSAVSYGIAAFILVSVVGLNAGFGALAGVITYLYFRFEALRDYEKEDKRYEDSKRELLQTL
jgi:hypothetical protein